MILHIVTGPPGAGKTTWTKSMFPDLEVFDHDLKNKHDLWRRGPDRQDKVLHTSAPSHVLKDYWLTKAKRRGYTPKLYVIWVERMTAVTRMEERDGLRDSTRNDLHKSIQRWYSMYTRHPDEIRITNEGSPI